MACLNTNDVLQAVEAAFWRKYNDGFPPAYEQQKKAQMIAAFNGRSISASASAEWWTGSFYDDPEWINPSNNSHAVWHGERRRATVTSVRLACDGEHVTIDDIEVAVETIGQMEDFYERNTGGAA